MPVRRFDCVSSLQLTVPFMQKNRTFFTVDIMCQSTAPSPKGDELAATYCNPLLFRYRFNFGNFGAGSSHPDLEEDYPSASGGCSSCV